MGYGVLLVAMLRCVLDFFEVSAMGYRKVIHGVTQGFTAEGAQDNKQVRLGGSKDPGWRGLYPSPTHYFWHHRVRQ